jgi:hypothetical protein
LSQSFSALFSSKNFDHSFPKMGKVFESLLSNK